MKSLPTPGQCCSIVTGTFVFSRITRLISQIFKLSSSVAGQTALFKRRHSWQAEPPMVGWLAVFFFSHHKLHPFFRCSFHWRRARRILPNFFNHSCFPELLPPHLKSGFSLVYFALKCAPILRFPADVVDVPTPRGWNTGATASCSAPEPRARLSGPPSQLVRTVCTVHTNASVQPQAS